MFKYKLLKGKDNMSKKGLMLIVICFGKTGTVTMQMFGTQFIVL